ncbi:MAG: leucyl aminopeptidase family protein [Hyphomicrobiaceae bacterium]
MNISDRRPDEVLIVPGAAVAGVPIWLAPQGDWQAALAQLPRAQIAWLEANGFDGSPRKHVLLPGAAGTVEGVVLGIGTPDGANAGVTTATLVGALPPVLPAGTYRLGDPSACDPAMAAIAWGLGAYAFRRYKANGPRKGPALVMPETADAQQVMATVEGVWLGRDLINTPANDMGPAELELAARARGARHDATVTAVIGDDLIEKNFPLIHAVGRASARAPRLIDLTWGRADAVKITLIGKGICFDTGGLDVKTAAGMLLMKKDMGGAATALALAHMIMSAELDVRLRVLIPAAENAIAGAAFRPGDVIRSRAGTTVEIGNTDAEGRLVLADALALADEEAPDHLFTFATLTGAARVALGPDLPPFFCDDEGLASEIGAAGAAVADPVWRLPLTTPYDSWLDSSVADMNNVAESGFAGAVVAAIFLKRFVKQTRTFAHFDIYGWRPAPRALGPKGGEPQAARAVFEVVRRIAGG